MNSSKLLFGNVYQVVENPHEKDAGIEIIDGEFKGLVYQYGDVQFEDGKPHLNFQRTIRLSRDSPYFGLAGQPYLTP